MGAVCGVFTSLADALSSPDTALGRARRTTLVDAGAGPLTRAAFAVFLGPLPGWRGPPSGAPDRRAPWPR
ncbi:hypothetical protein [Actinacidiphila glaucinigra]|uniref:hypothetical protein n=1 Tax=Actinacidiphila glaucinigra TaxID=235986 RepID=UPI00299FC98D|nr:hypothetical protein [Streptomyces sp. PA03-3a]